MSHPSQDNVQPAGVFSRCVSLRRFDGGLKDFWQQFLELAGEAAHAARVVLIRRDAEGRWRQMSEWSAESASLAGLALFRNALKEMADECAESGLAQRFLEGKEESGAAGLVVKLDIVEESELVLLALFLRETSMARLEDVIFRIRLMADVPRSYQEWSAVSHSKSEVEKLAVVLDSLTEVNAAERYEVAVMSLCNTLASRMNCRRVSLGWLERGIVRVKGISRTEKFDRRMEAVEAIEKTMEESLSQDDEVFFPAPRETASINRMHEKFATEKGVHAVCSVPIRHEDQCVAVVCLERDIDEFSPIELQELRVICDQGVHRLVQLKEKDRWFGARMAAALRRQCARLLGPEDTWKKVAALVVVGVLAACWFTKLPYRVEGDFILRSDEMRVISAPFDGFLGDSKLRPGDIVQQGDVLLELKTDDLLLEEAATIANLARFQREMEDARAEKRLAEMRIAQAQIADAEARLATVRYRLGLAQVTTPFAGEVLEGSLRNRIGSALNKGEALLRLARIDRLYVEVEIAERDIGDLRDVKTGEIAFVSRPAERIPVRVVQIEPAAVPKEQRNVFLSRCEVEGELADWWRPGMSGVCKLNVGDRRLLLIMTHRTVDFLRMWLWW